MKFKENLESVASSDFWYDLFEGGYFDDMLEVEDEKKQKSF